MCEAMVPRRQGSGWLSAGVTGVQELILAGVTERWQMRGQRRAADLVFGGSMNSAESTLSMRCSGTCPLCVFADRETQPRCRRALKRRRKMRQSPCRGGQRGPKVRGNNQRERDAMATCSRTYQPLARKQNRSDQWLFLGGVTTDPFNFPPVKFYFQ